MTQKRSQEVKKDETKSEEKKDDVKKEEEKKEDDIVEIIDEEKKVTEEPQEYDYVERLGRFVKFITWDHTDAPYYLKEVRGKKVLSTEDQNEAMTKMLESFVANDGKSPAQQQSSIFILYLLCLKFTVKAMVCVTQIPNVSDINNSKFDFKKLFYWR